MKLNDFLITEARDADPYEILELLYREAFPFLKEWIRYAGKITMKSDFFWSGRNGYDPYKIARIRKDRQPKDTPDNIHEMLDDEFFNSFKVRYRSNSIFVTGDPGAAKHYGDDLYAIFPIGKYNFAYHPNVKDLYSEVVESGSYMYYGMDTQDIIYELLQDGYGSNDIYDDARDIAEKQFLDNHSPDEFENDEGEFDEYAFQEAKEDYIDDSIGDISEDLARQRADSMATEAEDDVSRLIADYKENKIGDAIRSKSEIMLSGEKYLMIRYDYMAYIIAYLKKFGSQKPTKERFHEAMKDFERDSVHFRNYNNSVGDIKKSFKRYIRANPELESILDLKGP